MAVFTVSNTKITGIAAAIPKNKESNHSLTRLSEDEIQLLIQTTGISERRVAEKGVCASDLCAVAAEKLISDLGWKKNEIGVLVFVTQTPDYILPATGMVLQHRLGLSKDCMTLDINQGCAGYVYGLSMITSLLSASGQKKGLLLVGDTITKLLKEGDNSTVPIFADAGSATAIEYDSDAHDISFNLQTDGANFEAIIAKEGAARHPEKSGKEFLSMKGHDIFTFGLREVVPNITTLLTNASISTQEVDFFVFHQANLLLNESIRRKLGVDKSKTPNTLTKYGNTSCATIPVTLVSELSYDLKSKNQRILLSGFGVGLSWGSALVNISYLRSSELIEV